jgi:thiamine biosynthesis lipoprotein
MQGVNSANTGKSSNSLSRRRFLAGRLNDVEEQEGYWIHVNRAAMACRFEITLPMIDSDRLLTAREALDGIDRLESQLTVFRENSEISFINRNAALSAVKVEERLFDLFLHCRDLNSETDGAFDIASGCLTRCWGFLRRRGRIPDSTELDAAIASSGMQHVQLDSDTRTIRFTKPGIEINLGSIGKGYALDRIASEMRRGGLQSALLNGGSSSVVAIGGGADGTGWLVGIRHPRSRNLRFAELKMRDCAMGTSGSAEQFFEHDGKKYGHIIDPRCGLPARGVDGATVVADSGARADALATAFFVGGRELAERYCSTHSEVLVLMFEEGVDQPGIIGSHSRCEVKILE